MCESVEPHIHKLTRIKSKFIHSLNKDSAYAEFNKRRNIRHTNFRVKSAQCNPVEHDIFLLNIPEYLRMRFATKKK